jgi:hypothetical protein
MQTFANLSHKKTEAALIGLCNTGVGFMWAVLALPAGTGPHQSH